MEWAADDSAPAAGRPDDPPEPRRPRRAHHGQACNHDVPGEEATRTRVTTKTTATRTAAKTATAKRTTAKSTAARRRPRQSPQPKKTTAAPATKKETDSRGDSTATGRRRKEAIARVRLVPGTGGFQLNGRTLDEYFTTRAHRMVVAAPLRLVERDKDLDVVARIEGGGVSGQAGALRLGIARALIELDPELRAVLKKEGFLSRDAREKERRKYGLKKARKAPQYSKR